MPQIRTVIATVCLLMQLTSRHADISEPKPDPAPTLTPRCEVRYRCGYVNASGKPVTPAIFKIAKPFFEGRASVYLEGSGWGIIDADGRYIIKPTFAFIGPFSEGLAAACPDEKNVTRWVYLDRAGNVAITLPWNVTHAFPFHDGRAIVNGPWLFSEQNRLIDRTGRVLETVRKWN